MRVLVLAWFFYFAHSVQSQFLVISLRLPLLLLACFIMLLRFFAHKSILSGDTGPIVISSISNYCSVFIVQLSTSFVSFINDFSNRSVLSHN